MCDLSNDQTFFYGIYGSEFNKETLITLKEKFTVEEILAHQQFITIQEDLQQEAREEATKGR